MAGDEQKIVRLWVALAMERDVGKGTARMSSGPLNSLKLQEENVIEIMRKRGQPS